MIKKMVVKTDGFRLIGRVKTKNPTGFKVRGCRSWKSVKFDKYYYEARDLGIKDKELPDYIQDRFWDDAEDIINDTIDDKEFEILYENFQNRLHKRLLRYREKLLLNEWNFFVTFTYVDDKITREEFEKQLLIAFNNLAKRKGWRIVGGWENGELRGRVHFHAFVYVPDGQMVGELYTAHRYSCKRHKMEYYTENSYFFNRFGMSDWIAITHDDIAEGGLVSYLVKYVVKTGRRLFYSRGIPNELEMDVDTDTDILVSYKNHGIKHLLNFKKNGMEGLQALFDTSIDYTQSFILDESFSGFCDDRYKLVTVYT